MMSYLNIDASSWIFQASREASFKQKGKCLALTMLVSSVVAAATLCAYAHFPSLQHESAMWALFGGSGALEGYLLLSMVIQSVKLASHQSSLVSVEREETEEASVSEETSSVIWESESEEESEYASSVFDETPSVVEENEPQIEDVQELAPPLTPLEELEARIEEEGFPDYDGSLPSLDLHLQLAIERRELWFVEGAVSNRVPLPEGYSIPEDFFADFRVIMFNTLPVHIARTFEEALCCSLKTGSLEERRLKEPLFVPDRIYGYEKELVEERFRFYGLESGLPVDYTLKAFLDALSDDNHSFGVEEDDLICPITLEQGELVTLKGCGHSFSREGLADYQTGWDGDCCPTCRAEMSEADNNGMIFWILYLWKNELRAREAEESRVEETSSEDIASALPASVPSHENAPVTIEEREATQAPSEGRRGRRFRVPRIGVNVRFPRIRRNRTSPSHEARPNALKRAYRRVRNRVRS